MLDVGAIYNHLRHGNGEMITLDDALEWFPPGTYLRTYPETNSIWAEEISDVDDRVNALLLLHQRFYSTVNLIVLINKEPYPVLRAPYDRLVRKTYDQLMEVDNMKDASKKPINANGETISNKPVYRRLKQMWHLPHLCYLNELYVGKFGPEYKAGFAISMSQSKAKDMVRKSFEKMEGNYAISATANHKIQNS